MPRRTRFLASAEAQAQERSKALAPRTFRQHVDDEAPLDNGGSDGGGDADPQSHWSDSTSRSVGASPTESPCQSRASLRLPIPGSATAALDAALSLAPTPPVPSSFSGRNKTCSSYLAFGRRSPPRAKVERAEQPPVALRRFSLEADGPPSPRQTRSPAPLPPAAPDADALFDYSELDDAEQCDGDGGGEGCAANSAQAHLALLMEQRRSTFLTGLDLGTQMHLMRAHYRSYATGAAQVKLHHPPGGGDGDASAQDPAVAQPAELPGGRGGGSRTARSSRRASLCAGDIDEGEPAVGSQSARPATTHPGERGGKRQKKLPRASRHSAGTVLRHSSGPAPAASASTAWPSASGGSGGVGSGGAKAQVFNTAVERFPPSEKAELGLHNAVSLYTALPRELCAATIQSSSKLLLKYRLPRSSELEAEVFVRALPGMQGVPLRSPHAQTDADGGASGAGAGFVSALPRRNLFLLNPATLDPITPGPGAYMGLVRAQYEREKVAQLGGVMRTVTATNGILRTRIRAQDEALAERERCRALLEEAQAAAAPTGSTVATRASQTQSGRAQTSAAFQAALYGTGSLTALSRRRLRNERPQVNLDTLGECVTTFGLSERSGALGQWDIERRRTFLGPGSYAGAIESRQESGFARYGCAASTAALAAAEVLHCSAPANAVAIESGGVVIGGRSDDGTGTAAGASAVSASLVAAKLNYTPLPSALRAPTRDGLASVPKCVQANPGPAAYRVKYDALEAHVAAPRMVAPRERALLEALRGAGADLGLAAPAPAPAPGHGRGPRAQTGSGSDPGAGAAVGAGADAGAPVADGEAAPTTSAATMTAKAAVAAETALAVLPHGHKRSASTRRRATHAHRSKLGKNSGAPRAPVAHVHVQRPRGPIGEHVADESAGPLRGYFVEGERSLGVAPTKTPGPGSYNPGAAGGAGGLGGGLDGDAAAVLPSLAPFGSSAKRGVGAQSRGINSNEMDAMVSPRERHAAAKHVAADTSAAAAKAKAKTNANTRVGTSSAAAISSQPTNEDSDEPVPVAKSASEEQKESQAQASVAAVAAATAAAATTSAPQLASLIRAQRARAAQLEWAAAHASGPGAGAEAADRSTAALRRFLLHQAQTAPMDGGPAKAEAVAAELAKDLPPPPGASPPRATGPTPAQERQWVAEARRAAMRDKVVRLGAERAERLALIEARASHIAHRSLRAVSLQRWLALLVHASFLRQCHAVHTGRQSVLREMEAALRIQESWAAFRARRAAHARFAALRARLRNCMLHYVIARRIRRKRAAAALVARFLVDHIQRKNQKMFRVLHHFKACVLRIQRAWRRWAAKHRAALVTHLAWWERVLHEPDALTAWMERRGLPVVTGGAGGTAAAKAGVGALHDPARSRVRQDTAASSGKKRAPSMQMHAALIPSPGPDPGPASAPALVHKHSLSLSTLHETAPTPVAAGAAATGALPAPPTPSSAAHARANSIAPGSPRAHHASTRSQSQLTSPGAAGAAAAAPRGKVQYFNQLKEVILEKLHERRVRLEAEEKRRAALQAIATAATAATAASSGGGSSSGRHHAASSSGAAGGASLVGSRRASGTATPTARAGFGLVFSPAHSPSASPPTFAAAAAAAAAPAPLDIGLAFSSSNGGATPGADVATAASLAGELSVGVGAAAGPSWAAEREAYRTLFLPRPRRAAFLSVSASPSQARKADAVGGGGSGSGSSHGVSAAELAALAPLQLYVLRMHGAALENRPLPRGKIAPLPLPPAAPSDANASSGADVPRVAALSPSPSQPPLLPQQQSLGTSALGAAAGAVTSPRARLPSPKGRKPLYPAPRQSTLVLPSPSAAAAAAALELGLSCPRTAVHKSAQRALRDAQRRQEARLALDAVVEMDEEGDDNAIVRPAAGAATSASSSSASAAIAVTGTAGASTSVFSAPSPPPLSWHGMVVSEAIKIQLLRAALREARHRHWRLLSSYRRTLDAFLSSKLSSSESSLERARLFLTGRSAKLLADQREYARAHPVPRLAPLLPRPLMRALIVQGHLDQAEALDALALRRQELMRLIQAAPVPHHVPDLFGSARDREKEKEKERENAGRRSGPVSPRSASSSNGQTNGAAAAGVGTGATAPADAPSPPAARKYTGLRNLNSTLLPSPVRLLRMQQKQQAQAEADALGRGLGRDPAAGGGGSSSSSGNSGSATPLLQHQQQHRLLVLEQLRRGRLVPAFHGHGAPSRPRSPSATSATFLAIHVAPPVAEAPASSEAQAQASPATESGCAALATDTADTAEAAVATAAAAPGGDAESGTKEAQSAPEDAQPQAAADEPSIPAAAELSAILYSLATNSSRRFAASAPQSAGDDRVHGLSSAGGGVGAGAGAGMDVRVIMEAPRRVGRPSHGRKPTMEAAALFRHRHPLLPMHSTAAPTNQPPKVPVAPATVAPPVPLDPHPLSATVQSQDTAGASLKGDAAAALVDAHLAAAP